MADDRFGRWAPLTIDEARRELDDCPAPWWLSGGVALELFAGRAWRIHDDLDIGISRRDAVTVLDHLRRRGWDVVVAATGTLTSWDGGALSESSHHNNVWCRRPDGAWALDVTIGAGDDDAWSYRRDPAITRPWAEAVHERDGARFLAPELQLLFKSKNVRPKDTVDDEQVVPLLAGGGLALLAGQLRGQQHPWRSLIQAHAPQCSAADVHHVLDLLVAAGLDAWVDGGWAVDALLGEQTRPHADLDLAIARPNFDAALRLLDAHGFRTIRDDGPHIQVVADANGRIVDLHAFDPTVTTSMPAASTATVVTVSPSRQTASTVAARSTGDHRLHRSGHARSLPHRLRSRCRRLARRQAPLRSLRPPNPRRLPALSASLTYRSRARAPSRSTAAETTTGLHRLRHGAAVRVSRRGHRSSRSRTASRS